jgi:glucokinase
MPELTLAVDLSDSVARAALIDAGGQVVSRGEAAGTAALDARAVRDAAKRALSGAADRVSAAGVAMPSAFEQVPAEITAALRELTSRDTAVVLVAAGNAAAVAEQWIGAAKGLQQVVALAVGEHVTAGILVNGEPWLGAHGFAASVSWLAMNPVEREDYRRFGSLAAEISSNGIVRRFVWRIKSGDESSVADQVKGDFSKITAASIFQGSRDGDGVAMSVVRDTAKYIGMAAANLVTIFDPEIVVLGGVIAQAGDVLLDAIKSECGRRLHPRQAEQVRLVRSTLGSDAVLIGAARAAARG